MYSLQNIRRKVFGFWLLFFFFSFFFKIIILTIGTLTR